MRFLAVIIFLFVTVASQGQALHSRNKKAINLYDEATQLDQFGNYYKSEKLLLEALKKDKSFDEAIVLLHQVYIKRDLFSSSESILTQSEEELEVNFKNRILLDQAYFLNADGKYEYCRDKLQLIEGSIWQVSKELFNQLKRANDFALNQIESAMEIDFEELPTPLNKFDLQYFPSISFQNELVFTVRQKIKGGDENLFVSRLLDGKWEDPVQLSTTIHTQRNEGTASISGDGKTLVFTACNRPRNHGSCDLYISYKTEDWSEPELLPLAINSTEWDSQPSLSSDGNTLYFTSLRKGGYGKQDVWYSTKTDGVWASAINLGRNVNTPYDDASPFIYYDNQTLIYASKGRLGMGGFDLYKTELSRGEWSKPINLGYPINNSFDQIGYSISFDGWAYFSSSLANGRLVLKRFRVPEQLVKPFKKVVRVVEEGNKTLSTKSITLSKGQELIESLELDSLYSFPFIKMSGLDSVSLKAEGYQVKTVLKNDLISKPVIELTPIEIGEVLLETTGNFEFGSDIVMPELTKEMDRLFEFLQTNPELQVEVRGHTDLVGTSEFNYQLSLARAQNVANYLIEIGLEKSRITYKGFGETKPKVKESDMDKSSINRRVEVVVSGYLRQ